jgi:hypothetical protein
MTGTLDFIAGLTRAGKDYKRQYRNVKRKKTVDAAFGIKILQKMTIYDIIKKVKTGESTADQRHLNPKKTVRTSALIPSVAATVEEDWRVMNRVSFCCLWDGLYTPFTSFFVKIWA